MFGEKYKIEQLQDVRQDNPYDFFNEPVGIFERLTMIGIDDALMNLTDQKGPYGLSPIGLYIANVVPRVVWKGKPNVNMGNTFSHGAGLASVKTTRRQGSRSLRSPRLTTRPNGLD